jgi:hypothetical protein
LITTIAELWPAPGGQPLPSTAYGPIEKVPKTFVGEVLVVAGIEIVKTFLDEHTDSLQLSLAPLQQCYGLAQRFVGRRETAGLHASGDELLMIRAELNFHAPV